MIRRPPRSTRTDTLFPYTTLFRSKNVVLPTLGPERRETYSPFLPLCPRTGRVLQVPVLEVDADAGTIVYQDEYGRKVERSEEHTSELQSLMRISYAVFCLKKKTTKHMKQLIF